MSLHRGTTVALEHHPQDWQLRCDLCVDSTESCLGARAPLARGEGRGAHTNKGCFVHMYVKPSKKESATHRMRIALVRCVAEQVRGPGFMQKYEF